MLKAGAQMSRERKSTPDACGALAAPAAPDRTKDVMEIVSRYTRRQALEDGVLVDVSATVKEAGIRFPTAMTAAVFEKCVNSPENVPCQDEAGRLWDVVWMLRHALLTGRGAARPFKVLVKNDAGPACVVALKAHCGRGDEGEPVVTVMLPEED